MAIRGSIDLRLRPLKLAFVVDPNDAQQIKAAIQINTYLWGGMFNPIIAGYKRIPSNWGYLARRRPEHFTAGYLDAYDPDFIVKMGKSLPPYLQKKGLPVISPEQVVKFVSNENTPRASYGIGVEKLLEDLYEKEFKYLRKDSIHVLIPRLPKKHGLFFASLYGNYAPSVLDGIRRHYKELLGIEEVDVVAGKLRQLFKENVLFPIRITIRGIENTQRSRLRRTNYLLVMDAGKLSDILDYWNLRALGRDVFPMPIQFIDDDAWLDAAKAFLVSTRTPPRSGIRIFGGVAIVKSAGITPGDMKRLTTLLPSKLADTISLETGYPYPLQMVFPRIWDEWARNHDGVLCDDFYLSENSNQLSDSEVDRVLVKPLTAPFANAYGPDGNPMYANELNFEWSGSTEFLAECLPKDTGAHLLDAIGYGGFNRGDWRIGRNGVVSYISGPHSKLWEIPQAEKVLFAWLKDRGWVATLSTSGVLAKQIFSRLDGNVNAFKYAGFIELLEHINGGKQLKQTKAPAADQPIVDRNMSVKEVRGRLIQIFKDPGMYEFLSSKGVFQLGLRTQCPACLRHSWYSMRAISDEFHCPKCLNAFSAIGNIEAGDWSIKTGGPFSIANYGEGAYSVLLAYKFLKDFGHSLSLSTTAVLSFNATSSNGKAIEADLACFWREHFFDDSMDGVLFAECKSFGEFKKKDFEKMELLAKTFPGAILMFCTLRDKLSTREIGTLRRITRAGRRYWKDDRSVNPVLILTRAELISLVGVPMCWGMENATKFKNRLGLLNLCDTTQQIYLGLPPVEDYWKATFEKKREKRSRGR